MEWFLSEAPNQTKHATPISDYAATSPSYEKENLVTNLDHQCLIQNISPAQTLNPFLRASHSNCYVVNVSEIAPGGPFVLGLKHPNEIH